MVICPDVNTDLPIKNRIRLNATATGFGDEGDNHGIGVNAGAGEHKTGIGKPRKDLGG